MAQTLSPVSPVAGVADTSFDNSRIFCNVPHTDGYIMAAPDDLSVSATVAPTLVRIGNGRWALQRTAAGAETLYFRSTLDQILRTGEYQQFGGFGSGQQAQNYNTKGITIQSAFALFSVGVVALTSATLRIGRTLYNTYGAPTQQDLVAATGLGNLGVNANPVAQFLSVPTANQVFESNFFSLVEVELAVVLANTGSISVEGLGLDVGFNYN